MIFNENPNRIVTMVFLMVIVHYFLEDEKELKISSEDFIRFSYLPWQNQNRLILRSLYLLNR